MHSVMKECHRLRFVIPDLIRDPLQIAVRNRGRWTLHLYQVLQGQPLGKDRPTNARKMKNLKKRGGVGGAGSQHCHASRHCV